MCSLNLNATALTVSNVTTALQDLSARVHYILRIPVSKCEELRHEFTSDEEYISAAVKFWMLHDPLAGWRRLVDQLYLWCLEYPDLEAVGDRIRHYAEDLTGMYMTYQLTLHDVADCPTVSIWSGQSHYGSHFSESCRSFVISRFFHKATQIKL